MKLFFLFHISGKLVNYVMIVSTAVSVMTLMVMGLDRYQAVVSPVQSRANRYVNPTKVVLDLNCIRRNRLATTGNMCTSVMCWKGYTVTGRHPCMPAAMVTITMLKTSTSWNDSVHPEFWGPLISKSSVTLIRSGESYGLRGAPKLLMSSKISSCHGV